MWNDAFGFNSKKQKSTRKTGLTEMLPKKVKAAVQISKTMTARVVTVPITKTKEMKKKERDDRLKEEYRRIQKEKFVNSLKTHCRCDNIKSFGNGL